jgi:hypothetical protein
MNNVIKNHKMNGLSLGARSIVFLSIGGILIISSVLFQSINLLIQSILFQLGIVVISIVVINYLWKIAGGEPLSSEIKSLNEEVDRLQNMIDVIECSKNIGLLTQVHLY